MRKPPTRSIKQKKAREEEDSKHCWVVDSMLPSERRLVKPQRQINNKVKHNTAVNKPQDKSSERRSVIANKAEMSRGDIL